MTDYQFLGLKEHYTLDELKLAFRKKSKLYHPDRNHDSYKSHLIMIQLNKAYRNLRDKIKDSEAKQEKSSLEENVYKIYKEGITYYQNIHPSKWKSINDIYNSHSVETDPKTVGILDELINSMAKAYHCFSVIRNEYPSSCWQQDAVQKIKEIEKMTLRYAKIKKSYEMEFSKIV